MKTSNKIIVVLPFVVAAFGTAVAHAADSKKAPVVVPRSVFSQPTNASEGRDPFYPESSRTGGAQNASAANTSTNAVAAKTPDVTDLKVHGISGAPGHLLAIINNHTFGAGDEGEVLTDSGRVLLHCIEVGPNYVTIQISGRVHRLNLNTPKQP
jgi:hypothetical protein